MIEIKNGGNFSDIPRSPVGRCRKVRVRGPFCPAARDLADRLLDPGNPLPERAADVFPDDEIENDDGRGEQRRLAAQE